MPVRISGWRTQLRDPLAFLLGVFCHSMWERNDSCVHSVPSRACMEMREGVEETVMPGERGG